MKTLRRTKLGRLTSLPIADVHFGQHPSFKSFLGNLLPSADSAALARINPTVDSLREGFSDLAIAASRARKPADPAVPLGFIDKVKEFIHFNAPNVDFGPIAEILTSVKTPLLVTLGVATAAGLAYLAYKVYQNRSKIPQVVDKIMSDIRATVPDLMKVQGWAESIRKEITGTVSENADNPARLVAKVAQIKDTVMDHQSTINPDNIGAGINMICKTKPHRPANHRNPRKKRRGAGLKVPI